MDLHDLGGLNPRDERSYRDAGIDTVEDLAHTDPRVGIPGVSADDFSTHLARARLLTDAMPGADLLGDRNPGRRKRSGDDDPELLRPTS